jgi:hypothetical protein
MAQVRIDEVIDYLSQEITKALEDAVRDAIPGATFDRNRLFREFSRAVYRHCSNWENVPDQYVRQA